MSLCPGCFELEAECVCDVLPPPPEPPTYHLVFPSGHHASDPWRRYRKGVDDELERMGVLRDFDTLEDAIAVLRQRQMWKGGATHCIRSSTGEIVLEVEPWDEGEGPTI